MAYSVDSLPGNGIGTWTGLNSEDFNFLIQHVDGIAFNLDLTGGSSASERVFIDNICFQNNSKSNIYISVKE